MVEWLYLNFPTQPLCVCVLMREFNLIVSDANTRV